jgi:hypothetical protein
MALPQLNILLVLMVTEALCLPGLASPRQNTPAEPHRSMLESIKWADPEMVQPKYCAQVTAHLLSNASEPDLTLIALCCADAKWHLSARTQPLLTLRQSVLSEDMGAASQ